MIEQGYEMTSVVADTYRYVLGMPTPLVLGVAWLGLAGWIGDALHQLRGIQESSTRQPNTTAEIEPFSFGDGFVPSGC